MAEKKEAVATLSIDDKVFDLDKFISEVRGKLEKTMKYRQKKSELEESKKQLSAQSLLLQQKLQLADDIEGPRRGSEFEVREGGRKKVRDLMTKYMQCI